MVGRPEVSTSKLAAAFIWAIPFVAVGLVIAITVVGIPITILLFWIGCYPLFSVIQKHMKAVHNWNYRDRPLPSDQRKPWEE